MEYEREARTDIEPEFIDHENAPIICVDGLLDVYKVGNSCWFLFYEDRMSRLGNTYKHPCWVLKMPCDNVGPGISRTIRRVGRWIMIPAADALFRWLECVRLRVH